ncbi:WD40/YVTN/BNR-like repeat-containing protein [Candidatus Methylacidiphilum infernorum]|uniref:WD40/YVTN/BNR-like repeat-containing protein n=1 Tax=Candidatus Methylacidiphilum infernorum TaxID=511746 RepID=UPI0003074320|nr:hypothetical protein [Candidatus Methylacidiphilum infernorum]
MNKLSKPSLFLLFFVFSSGFGLSQGSWQGYPVAPSPFLSPSNPQVLPFDLTDTGGTGGGFGLGNPHTHLWDIDCWDERICWSCGFGGVFKSVDGGYHWETIKSKGGWYHVQLTGKEEIWLLEGFHGEAKGRLWYSKDDGKSWEEILAGQVKGFGGLICKGPVRFVLCNDFPSLMSLDHGKTWQFLHSLFGSLQVSIPGDVKQEKGFTIYALGHKQQKPYLLQSKDSGRSWKEISLPEGLPYPRSLFFSSSWMGWIGFDQGKILATSDGAESWQLYALPTQKAVTALWFDEEGRGFAAVDNGNYAKLSEALFRTEDGGKSWKLALSGAKQFNRLLGLGLKRFWAVGFVPGTPNDLVAILNLEKENLPSNP